MDAFDEWAKTSTHPCVQKWADRLIELGASWDSFRDNLDQVVNDLVTGGIPPLAARDICNIASQVVRSKEAPMAVFWDIENMSIPTNRSGREVASRLKSILASHGTLTQFRAYANIELGLIPQNKRSELQLSGCCLVDCPSNGRKDVADKMIIVDAMQFAYMHPEGATLCFITGDVDYAYLLAALQRPQWRIIVISKGTMQSMLHGNCDMKMCWETDILQLGPLLPKAPPGFELTLEPPSALAAHPKTGDPIDVTRDYSSNYPPRCHVAEETALPPVVSFAPLTPDEKWEDDLQLLHSVLEHSCCGVPKARSALKSLVGSKLRVTNPARFPNRESVRAFLARAIETKAVIETGEGATKVLNLPGGGDTDMVFPAVSISDDAPLAVSDMPEKALELSGCLPYILFALWSHCPQGNKFSKQTFVQSSGKWAILMFRTLADAHRQLEERPWLRVGTLVDWRRNQERLKQIPEVQKIGHTKDSEQTATCSKCDGVFPVEDMMMAGSRNKELHCQQCFSWNDDEKEEATRHVVAMLKMMADNDDVFVAIYIARKQLCLRYPDQCASRKQGQLWIEEAVKAGKVISFKRAEMKVKLICLSSRYMEATAPFPAEGIDTSKEEEHVLDLLWAKNGWMPRVDAIASLKDKFETMSTPFIRNKVFLNAWKNGHFFIAKGPFGQTLGLTKEDAELALRTMYNSSADQETSVSDSATIEESAVDLGSGEIDSHWDHPDSEGSHTTLCSTTS